MASDMSRHSMDVDNTHWPRPRWYRGDTNASLDWFEHEMQAEISPYVGIGRRHASQQWISKLSAHVWVQGWLASYYLDGYHRGLDEIGRASCREREWIVVVRVNGEENEI